MPEAKACLHTVQMGFCFMDWTHCTLEKKHSGQDEYKCDKCDKVTHSLASH